MRNSLNRPYQLDPICEIWYKPHAICVQKVLQSPALAILSGTIDHDILCLCIFTPVRCRLFRLVPEICDNFDKCMTVCYIFALVVSRLN